MISAKKAREKVEYLNSEERQKEIIRGHIEDGLVYLNTRIQQAIRNGEYSVSVNLRTDDPMDFCLLDVNLMDDIEERVKEKGFEVDVTIKDGRARDTMLLQPLVYQKAIVDAKLPIIKISW